MSIFVEKLKIEKPKIDKLKKVFWSIFLAPAKPTQKTRVSLMSYLQEITLLAASVNMLASSNRRASYLKLSFQSVRVHALGQDNLVYK